MKISTNSKPSEVTTSKRSTRGHPGFALIATLTLMVLLLILALGMLSLSTVSLRSGGHSSAQQIAQGNARMAMMLALGELQKVAGPDQRVTATASILGESGNAYTSAVTAVKGRKHWAGVWKSDVKTTSSGSASYDPSNPDKKVFESWLVSSPDPTIPKTLNSVASNPGINDLKIFEGESADDDVIVPKVDVTDSLGNDGAYAYWVEDQGVKADLGWYEGNFSTADKTQTARVEATPGPDYKIFEDSTLGWNFAGVNYPISKTSSADWVDKITKANSAFDMPLVAGVTNNIEEWQTKYRHQITIGSRGVMADVKLGGLRRDLSLAFEMDSIAAAKDATKFNSQSGEFVGGTDRFAAAAATPGMGNLHARHLYRDKQNSGSLFASNIITSGGVVRGPTWWALRDYANLYKRVTLSGSNYTLPARAYFPNTNSGATDMTDLFPAGASGGVWDWEFKNGTSSGTYIYRPAQANYAPVYLGMTCLIGVKVVNSKLAISLDPLFHFWNPYNVDLKFNSLGITMPQYAFPGRVTFWTKKAGTTTETKTSYNLFQFVNNGSSITTNTAFLLKDPSSSGGAISMKAGEVMVFSPTPVNQSSPGKISGDAIPGYFPAGYNDTGIIVSNFGGDAGNANLAPADEVGFVYTQGESGSVSGAGGSGRIEVHTSLPTVTNASDLISNPGENIQGYLLNLSPNTTGYKEYESTKAAVSTANAKSVTASGSTNANVQVASLGGKRFFGLFSVLTKPAHYTASPSDGSTFPSNPVEAFTRFNPLFLTSNEETWHSVPPNMLYNLVTSHDSNDLLNNYGMNLSAQPRNAFWGGGYDFNFGSTAVPMLGIPTSPLLSLAAFSNANLSVVSGEPMRAVGNSWSSPYFAPTSPYGQAKNRFNNANINQATAGDVSWLSNDALFDRYYLSGLAPDFTISGSGYSANGDLSATLTKFFSTDPLSARANPVLRPYLPSGKLTSNVISELAATEGYRKTGAYSLINGQFNVNSTSVAAWNALLRSNRDLALTYAQGSSISSGSNNTPFPNSSRPSNPTPSSPLSTQNQWAGLSRLTDAQINDLATKIVDQVKLRGPFMSLSDFINHRVGPLKNATSYTGALQAAIDLAASSSNINSSARSAVGSTIPDYSSGFFTGVPPTPGYTTSGVPGDLTQADILRPLAPRLSARTDTFRIRAYGEAKSSTNEILATAVCEVIVQRVPEYLDGSDEPWDESTSTTFPLDSVTNRTMGRRFRVTQFKWLTTNEL
ncbi:MAG: hypothetical protein ABJQ29_06950 [Luteolibacter sp.]